MGLDEHDAATAADDYVNCITRVTDTKSGDTVCGWVMRHPVSDAVHFLPHTWLPGPAEVEAMTPPLPAHLLFAPAPPPPPPTRVDPRAGLRLYATHHEIGAASAPGSQRRQQRRLYVASAVITPNAPISKFGEVLTAASATASSPTDALYICMASALARCASLDESTRHVPMDLKTDYVVLVRHFEFGIVPSNRDNAKLCEEIKGGSMTSSGAKFDFRGAQRVVRATRYEQGHLALGIASQVASVMGVGCADAPPADSAQDYVDWRAVDESLDSLLKWVCESMSMPPVPTTET